MKVKDIVAILMESPFYFDLTLAMRLKQVQLLRQYMGDEEGRRPPLAG